MASRRVTGESKSPKRRPATTPEARENQLIALAYDVAEQQMRDGSASSQIISHWLKAGSSREKLEQERLRGENILLEAKAKALDDQKDIKELYAKALGAMRSYQGVDPAEYEEDYDD